MGSYRDGPPRGADACGTADAEPRSAVDVAAVAEIAVNVAAVSVDVYGGEAAAGEPSLCLCERQVNC